MINISEERARIHLAESVTIPRDNYIELLDYIEALEEVSTVAANQTKKSPEMKAALCNVAKAR